MIRNLVLITASFLTSMLSIFFVLRLSKKYKLYDLIDERKVHTGNISRLGGVGIFIGFVVGLLGYSIYRGFSTIQNVKTYGLIVACGLIFVMGLWDDIKPWKAKIKLLAQIIASLIVVICDFTFTRISFSAIGFHWNLGWVRFPLTFAWIIGVTNAVNLIDGIDGLAGSLSFLSAFTFALFFFQYEYYQAMMVCLFLCAAIGGFLVFNFPLPKAKLFMGDGGSQFLGFILAILPLMQNIRATGSIALPFSFAVLIIPIFDTIAAFWRRTRERRSFFSPDKFHLHHKLMMLGFNNRQTLFIIVYLQVLISILTLLSGYLKGIIGLILLFVVYALSILFFTVIHIKKEEVLEKTKKLDV